MWFVSQSPPPLLSIFPLKKAINCTSAAGSSLCQNNFRFGSTAVPSCQLAQPAAQLRTGATVPGTSPRAQPRCAAGCTSALAYFLRNESVFSQDLVEEIQNSIFNFFLNFSQEKWSHSAGGRAARRGWHRLCHPALDPGTGAQPTLGPPLQGSRAAAGAPLSPHFIFSNAVFYIINCQLYQSSVICVLKMAWQN